MQSNINELTVQNWLQGSWHDAAKVTFHEPEKGHLGSTTTTYLLDYFVEHASVDAVQAPVVDERAVSVALPVGQDRWLPTWPSFLMDMLPQGPARILLAKEIGWNGVLAESEMHLLRYSAATPVGNLRIAEAAEREVLPGYPGISLDAVLGRTEMFNDYAAKLPKEVPSSVSLQGEWPKLMLTMADDGLLYPDACIPDSAARQRFIVKLARSRKSRDSLILEIEALYAAAAFDLGLPVPEGYLSGPGVIMIPRFDRDATDGSVRWGQESIVSAAGISQFGHLGLHEDYIDLLSAISSDPEADRLDYLKRDLLNLGFGNDDNHGRNTALSKKHGQVRLSQIFDLAPMRLSGNAVARSTRWKCMRGFGSDYYPKWDVVVEAITENESECVTVLDQLAAFAETLPQAAQKVAEKASDKDAVLHATLRLEALVGSVVAAAERRSAGISRG
jgi:HipA-like C-terminal domain./HipA-like N-terminal domain.